MIEQAAELSERAQAEWGRLARQLDFSSGFWLGFIFCPSARDARILKNRTQEIVSAAGRSFHVITPHEPGELATLYQSLAKMVDVGCVWVVALHVDPPHSLKTPWRDAWDNLFLRLNERRDLIHGQLNGGLVFVAPPDMKPRIREAAPDSWSLKAIVLDLPPHGQITNAARMTLPGFSVVPTHDKPSASIDLSALFRTQPTFNTDFAFKLARNVLLDYSVGKAFPLLDAAKGFFEVGDLEDAKTTAEEALALIQRERLVEGRADILLETRAHALLAEILCKLGFLDAARAHIRIAVTERRAIASEEFPLHWLALAGEIEVSAKNYLAAIALYREGLSILDSGRWRGEVDGIRGHIYMYAQLGCAFVAMKAFDAAADEFLNASTLARKLLSAGEPDISVVLSVLLKWLGDTWDAIGDSVHAESAYAEAVMLDRATLENQRDSIVAMRELSIGLNRLGGVQRQSDEFDDLQAACQAFEEALALRRAIVAKQRDRISLRDLLSSLKKVHKIKPYVVQSKKAFRSDVDPLATEIEKIAAEIRELDELQK